MHGLHVGWQSAIARKLRSRGGVNEVNNRTVRRWLASGHVPDWVEAQLVEMMGGTSPTPWPRDEWILGDGQDGREYIVHAAPPRFVARVVMVDEATGLPAPAEEPADVAGGIVYVVDEGTVLCEIEWIDEVDPGQVTPLIEAAADIRFIRQQCDKRNSCPFPPRRGPASGQ